MTKPNYISELFENRNYQQILDLVKGKGLSEYKNDPNTLTQIAMSEYFTGKSGYKKLSLARAIGSSEAAIWQAVIEYFQVSKTNNLDIDTFFYQYRYEATRRSAYMEYPLEVHIETQTVCNAACTFCPYPDLTRKGNKMSNELIEKIISDLKKIPDDVKFNVSPFKVSDPFLDKRLFEITKKINSAVPNASIRLFTNGSALTDSNIERTREVKNLHNLWISLNESDPDKYYAVMGISQAKTLKNLDNLHQKCEVGYPHQVIISRVSNGTDDDQEFIRFVNRRFPLFTSLLAKRSDWTGKIQEENLSKVPNVGCLRWFELSIMSDGKVSLCCMDGHGDYCLGDVNNQSILEIYNNQEYKKLRQMTNSRLASASPCDACNL